MDVIHHGYKNKVLYITYLMNIIILCYICFMDTIKKKAREK